MELNGVITVKNMIFKIKLQRSSHVLMTELITTKHCLFALVQENSGIQR